MANSGGDDQNLGTRRRFLKTSVAAATASVRSPWLPAQPTAAPPTSLELDEVTLEALRRGLDSGTFTARRLAELYPSRIETIDKAGPRVTSVTEINPAAVTISDEPGRERRQKGVRGPLHGVP